MALDLLAYGSNGLTDVVGANLQGFVPPHDEPNLLGLLMGEKPDISSTPLFPFIVDFGESEKFGPPIPSAVFEALPFRLSSEKRGMEKGWSGSTPFSRTRSHLHLEQNLLIFLVSLCLDLFSELNDGLELGVVLLSLYIVYVIGKGGAGSEGWH